jgi:hypothetical protein
MAGAMALLGIVLMRRRGAGIEKLGPGFAAALLVGSSGLFFLPALMPNGWTHAPGGGVGAVDRLCGRRDRRAGRELLGSPLLYSAVGAAGPHRVALRRAQAAAGAGGLRLRRRGRAAVRGGVPYRRRPLRAELPRPDLAGGQRRGRGLFATAVIRKS